MEKVTTVGIDLAKNVFSLHVSGCYRERGAAALGAPRSAGGGGGAAARVPDRH